LNLTFVQLISISVPKLHGITTYCQKYVTDYVSTMSQHSCTLTLNSKTYRNNNQLSSWGFTLFPEGDLVTETQSPERDTA